MNDQHADVYGKLLVRLRHPTTDPEDLARQVGLSFEPRPRSRDKLWCSTTILYECGLLDDLKDVLSALQRHEVELQRFVSDGGSIELYFQFNGRRNVGASIPPTMLKQLADLETHLDIEVFPNFGGDIVN